MITSRLTLAALTGTLVLVEPLHQYDILWMSLAVV